MLAPEDLEFQAVLAGKYSLERELGRGGMGVVCLAREALLDRQVAIKRLPADLADDPRARERFLREARTAAQLFHPNIVPIHRVDEIGRFVFFVMGFVDGETAGDLVRRRGKLPTHEVIRILRDAAYALGYGHARGVVHRDVKPDNLLIETRGGRTLVTDFGIAQQAGASALTRDGQLLGSVHYMSPEQISGEHVDGRADVYALGALAHFLLTGKPPFDNPAATAVLGMHLNQPAPPIASVARGIPPRLAAAIDRCLAKDPAMRFATAEAFAEALDAIEQRREVPAVLRAWVQGAGWFDPGLVIVGVVTFVTIVAAQNFYLLGVPVAYLLMQRVQATRRVLAMGYDSADLAGALLAEVDRKSEEGTQIEARPTMLVKALRIIALGSLACAVATFVGFNWIMANAHYTDARMTLLLRITFASFTFGSLAAVASGLLAELISPSKVLFKAGHFDLKWRLGFWKSRLAAPFARLLRRGTKPVNSAGVDRPTEVVVGGAAASLYDALPKHLKKEFPALPEVVEQLELRAG
jgi:serine/threonine-protein kinase